MSVAARIQNDSVALNYAHAENWIALADRLNEIAPSIRIPTAQARYSWVGLQDVFGVNRVVAWMQEIDRKQEIYRLAAPSIATKLKLFSMSLTEGYDFGNPKVREGLEELRQVGVLSETDVEELIALGTTREIVTPETVQSAWREYRVQAVVRQRNELRSKWREFSVQVENAIANGEEDVITYVSENWS